MTKRKIIIFIFSVLLFVSLFGQIFASFSSLNVLNEFTNGSVNVAIYEDNTDVPNNNQNLLPFDKIKKNPYIINNGSDCYVRVKLMFSNTDIVNDENIIWMNPNFIFKNDGYYYYNKVLEQNSTVEIFRDIQLGDIDGKYQSFDFDIGIQLDAVQNKNFYVDFDSDSPWGVVEILDSNSDYPQINEYQQVSQKSITISFQNGADKLISNFDNFFSDLSLLMPGDVYSDVLKIHNNSEHNQEIHFSTQSISNPDFLNNVKINIADENGNIIFDGKLGDSKSFSLGEIHSKSSKDIIFTIEVPQEVDNHHASESSAFQWTFSTKPIQYPQLPQTGDDSNLSIYIVLMIISLLGLIFSMGVKKDDKKNY